MYYFSVISSTKEVPLSILYIFGERGQKKGKSKVVYTSGSRIFLFGGSSRRVLHNLRLPSSSNLPFRTNIMAVDVDVSLITRYHKDSIFYLLTQRSSRQCKRSFSMFGVPVVTIQRLGCVSDSSETLNKQKM